MSKVFLSFWENLLYTVVIFRVPCPACKVMVNACPTSSFCVLTNCGRMEFLIRNATPGPWTWCGMRLYAGASPAVAASGKGNKGWNSCNAMMSAPTASNDDNVMRQRSSVMPPAPWMLKDAKMVPWGGLGFFCNELNCFRSFCCSKLSIMVCMLCRLFAPNPADTTADFRIC